MLVNIVMGASLHQHGHSHGGGGGHHSHGDAEGGQQGGSENINVKAAFIHVVGDFLQSLGVFTAALVIYFKPTWVLIDPICTFVFSLLVLATTLSILRKTVSVIMEGTPVGVSYSRVRNILLAVPGIRQVHNLRVWSLTTDKAALAAHLVIEAGQNEEVVLQQATTAIRREYGLYEMTLQVEQFQQDMESCGQCRDN